MEKSEREKIMGVDREKIQRKSSFYYGRSVKYCEFSSQNVINIESELKKLAAMD